jgi:hypothetical protein
VASNRTVTARQYVALYLYYVEGQSQGKIGAVLGIAQQNVSKLMVRGKRWLVDAVAEQGGVSLPRLTALLAPSPTSSPSANVGLAASRQEELADALELRLQQRATELAEVEECMSGDSSHPTRIKRNHYDQWELRYLAARSGEPLPTSAYYAGTAAAYCANRGKVCGLKCAGCETGVNEF